MSGDVGNQNAEGDPSAKGQKGKGAAAAQKAKNFANYALTKLKSELKVRGDRDD